MTSNYIYLLNKKSKDICEFAEKMKTKAYHHTDFIGLLDRFTTGKKT